MKKNIKNSKIFVGVKANGDFTTNVFAMCPHCGYEYINWGQQWCDGSYRLGCPCCGGDTVVAKKEEDILDLEGVLFYKA